MCILAAFTLRKKVKLVCCFPWRAGPQLQAMYEELELETSRPRYFSLFVPIPSFQVYSTVQALLRGAYFTGRRVGGINSEGQPFIPLETQGYNEDSGF